MADVLRVKSNLIIVCPLVELGRRGLGSEVRCDPGF